MTERAEKIGNLRWSGSKRRRTGKGRNALTYQTTSGCQCGLQNELWRVGMRQKSLKGTKRGEAERERTSGRQSDVVTGRQSFQVNPRQALG